MTVDTKAFGPVEIEEKQRIKIPLGLFGFEDYIEYVLIDAEHEPFFWLQSAEEKEIAFVLINPFFFRKDYEVNITNEDLAEIGITSPENALIFVIVTIPQDGSPMTANLQGPIIINKDTMTGMQAVLSDSKWKTRHDIIAELNGASGRKG
ncbi:MAG: flagellar assembly protein FliW [Treponema sp.]|nr:flagellar assembly protein FliW [Treponema sp.]